MRLIKDLGTKFPTENSKVKQRYGIYECPKCLIHFETSTNCVKRRECTQCLTCARKQKHKVKKHGESKTPLYAVWKSMKSRCNRETSNAYNLYGARGISVCEDWNNDYRTFRDWSMLNGYEAGLTLDRINNDGNYEPTNCRWTDWKTQNNNRRNSKK